MKYSNFTFNAKNEKYKDIFLKNLVEKIMFCTVNILKYYCPMKKLYVYICYVNCLNIIIVYSVIFASYVQRKYIIFLNFFTTIYSYCI